MRLKDCWTWATPGVSFAACVRVSASASGLVALTRWTSSASLTPGAGRRAITLGRTVVAYGLAAVTADVYPSQGTKSVGVTWICASLTKPTTVNVGLVLPAGPPLTICTVLPTVKSAALPTASVGPVGRRPALSVLGSPRPVCWKPMSAASDSVPPLTRTVKVLCPIHPA